VFAFEVCWKGRFARGRACLGCISRRDEGNKYITPHMEFDTVELNGCCFAPGGGCLALTDGEVQDRGVVYQYLLGTESRPG
jgi:hypothetical protein